MQTAHTWSSRVSHSCSRLRHDRNFFGAGAATAATAGRTTRVVRFRSCSDGQSAPTAWLLWSPGRCAVDDLPNARDQFRTRGRRSITASSRPAPCSSSTRRASAAGSQTRTRLPSAHERTTRSALHAGGHGFEFRWLHARSRATPRGDDSRATAMANPPDVRFGYVIPWEVGSSSNPSRAAIAAASARRPTSSLPRMLETWADAVLRLMNRVSAIRAFV